MAPVRTFLYTRNEAIKRKKKRLNTRYNIKEYATQTIETKLQYNLYV